MSLVGVGAGASPAFTAMVGSLAADGAGHVSPGILDVNSNATVTTNVGASGTLSVPSSSGRGTLTLTSTLGVQTFAYYQVDDTRLKLVEIDGANALAGDLLIAAGGSLHQYELQWPVCFHGGWLQGWGRIRDGRPVHHEPRRDYEPAS